jgi:hypothetical protein
MRAFRPKLSSIRPAGRTIWEAYGVPVTPLGNNKSAKDSRDCKGGSKGKQGRQEELHLSHEGWVSAVAQCIVALGFSPRAPGGAAPLPRGELACSYTCLYIVRYV